MTEVVGKAIAVGDDYIDVEVESVGCGRCHEEGGCGGVSIGSMACRTPRKFRVGNPGGVVAGSQVTVVVEDGVVRRSAALVYGLPLGLLLAGALLGLAMVGEPGAIAGSFAGLLLAVPCLRFAQHLSAGRRDFQPHIRGDR